MAETSEQLHNETDAEREEKRRKKRHYGDSCTSCRHGKRRCEGGHANQACSYCIKTGKFCSLASETTTLTTNTVEAMMGAPRSSPRPSSTTPRAAPATASASKGKAPDPAPYLEHIHTDMEDRMPKLLFSLGLDGRLEHFGESSHLHQPLLEKIAPRPVLPLSAVTPSLDRRFDVLAHAAVCALEEGISITPTESTLLIDTFFCWQVPQFSTVQRHLFMRDMALGGKYYNKLLLFTIYAQASRHVPSLRNRAELFESEARQLIGQHIHQNDYPTIQALLSFGGRDCALGRWSSGWVYIGIAIRMVQDRGLHMRISAKEPEERNTQVQLVWSAYVWDKAVSVWLGRMPMLSICPTIPCPPIDAQCDAELWHPVSEAPVLSYYTPQPNRQTECFQYSCKLWFLVDETYRQLYSGVADRVLASKSYLPRARQALDAFWETIPGHLSMETGMMLCSGPPPHILTMNAMLRAAWILLYRPFFKQQPDWKVLDAVGICLQRAEEIRYLLLIHERTFALQNVTYLLSYAAFVGATVFVLQLQEAAAVDRLVIIDKLNIFKRALSSGARHTPSIAQSLALIESRATLAAEQAVAAGYTTVTEEGICGTNTILDNAYLPLRGPGGSAPPPGPAAGPISEHDPATFGQLDFQDWMAASWNHAGFDFLDELAPNWQPNSS